MQLNGLPLLVDSVAGMTGLIRALPDPLATGPARAVQIAQRLPRMVRLSGPAIAANCEVAGMLAEQTGVRRA